MKKAPSRKKLKIVDVSEFYAEEGGGVRTYVRQKLQAGSKAGHEIVIVAPGPDNGESELLGGRIVWVKGPHMPFDPRYFVMLRKNRVREILDREKPDVVEGSSPWMGGWFVAKWKGDAVKSFIYHSDPVAVYPQTFFGNALGMDRVDRLFGLFWGYLRRISGHFDVTVTSGKWLADKLERFGLKNPQSVPFGIEKTLFSPKRRSVKVRKAILDKCGMPDDAALFIIVSRLHPEKRLGTLLKAFEIASKSRPMGLVIYGDGPQRKWLLRRIAKLRGVHFAGYTRSREEMADVMASADVFLHGSAAETYGLVVAEAICSGTPVIVPDRGGAADLGRPNYAEIYPTGSHSACAAAMLKILERDRKVLSKACVAASREKIGTMDDHFDMLFDLYASMVKNRKG